MAGALYLADTAVYVLQSRHTIVRECFAKLPTEGRPAACQMTALEYLTMPRTPRAYETLWTALQVSTS